MRKRRSEDSYKEVRERRTKALILDKNSKGNLKLDALYNILLKRFGFQHWWPGETKFEIFVGAILTQQTSWKNVEKSISALKEEKLLTIESISKIKLDKLEQLIKPSGYYKQKAKRLKSISTAIISKYSSLKELFKNDVEALRNILLSFNGIGRETADSIILYAAEKPIFVIDAYTKRIMNRLYNINENIDYDVLRKYFEDNLEKNVELYKDMHAQFVALGKMYCKKKDPICTDCPLNNYCSYKRNRKNENNINNIDIKR
ncbi:MAG: endonuclease III domain-containing protein [Candidatus Micrarchaeia archaeon]